MTLRDLENTRWVGKSELWLDPLGNKADTCDCSLAVGAQAIDYRWSYEGKEHTGKLALRAGGADFTDSFHSPTPMALETVAGSWAMVDVRGTWSAGDGPPWGWRIYLSDRPESDELVLQMDIIKPSGEEGRAVRMICKRA